MIAVSQISWQPAWRIIPSLFPPISLFDRVTDPADLEAIFAIESLTNDRIREEVGDLQLVAPEDRIAGAGTSVIMAAFTHLNPLGSRFSDGTYGVFYAADTMDTAIAETRYHREQFLRATDEAPIELDMRAYNVDLRGGLHDITGQQDALPDVYNAYDYNASQRFGRELREQHSAGIVYQSVRQQGGINAAVFRPPLLSNCRQERHLCYVWDGKTIATIYQKQLLH